MLKYLSICVAALLILPLAFARADGTESAWLYNPQVGLIWRVDASGAVETTHQLPAPIVGSYSPQIKASDDGQFIGYTVTALTGERRVVIYDVSEAEIQLAYTPEAGIAVDSFSAPSDEQPFSDDLQYFAYSYSRVTGGWRILLLNINTGSVVSVIGEGSASGLPPAGSPVVDEVSVDHIKFHVRPTTGRAPWQEYAWSLTTNRIAPDGLRYEDQIEPVQPTATAPAVQVTPMPTVSSSVLRGSSLENSGFNPNLLINIGNSARQPVGEGTPNAVVTLPPPSR